MNTNKTDLEAETPGKKDWLCHRESGGIVAFECVCGMLFRDSDYLTNHWVFNHIENPKKNLLLFDVDPTYNELVLASKPKKLYNYKNGVVYEATTSNGAKEKTKVKTTVQFEFTTDTGILTFTNLHDFVRFLIDKRGLSNFETIQDLVQKAMRTKKREVNILREDRPMKTLGHADTKKDPSLSSLKCEIHNYAAFCMKNDYFALDTTHNISLFDILPSETEASTNPSSAKKNNNEAKHAEEPMPIKTDIELTHSLQKLLFEKKDNDPNDQTQPPQINDGLLSETKPELSEIVRTPEKPISLFPKFVSKPSNSLASNIQKLHPGQVISRKIDISESHTNPTQELMKKKRGAIKNLPEPKPLEQLIAEKQNREELPANSMSNHKPTYVSSKAKEKKKKIAKRKPEPGPPTDEHKEILQQSVQDETSAKKEEDDSFERKIALMENLNRNSGLFNSVALRNIN